MERSSLITQSFRRCEATCAVSFTPGCCRCVECLGCFREEGGKEKLLGWSGFCSANQSSSLRARTKQPRPLLFSHYQMREVSVGCHHAGSCRLLLPWNPGQSHAAEQCPVLSSAAPLGAGEGHLSVNTDPSQVTLSKNCFSQVWSWPADPNPRARTHVPVHPIFLCWPRVPATAFGQERLSVPEPWVTVQGWLAHAGYTKLVHHYFLQPFQGSSGGKKWVKGMWVCVCVHVGVGQSV